MKILEWQRVNTKTMYCIDCWSYYFILFLVVTMYMLDIKTFGVYTGYVFPNWAIPK